MAFIGPPLAKLAIRGDIDADEDLTIEGRVKGAIWSDGHAVIVGVAATVVGEIVARDITVFGAVSGTLVASDVVDIRATARVTGRVVSGRLIVEEGAWLVGAVAPHQLTAALVVARSRHRKAQTTPPDITDDPDHHRDGSHDPGSV